MREVRILKRDLNKRGVEVTWWIQVTQVKVCYELCELEILH